MCVGWERALPPHTHNSHCEPSTKRFVFRGKTGTIGLFLLPFGEKPLDPISESIPLSSKLWLYTNFDCNLTCSYCVTESTPTALRRALSLAHVQRLVDEAIALGFSDVFLTGGEPFLLDQIYDIVDYASTRMNTTVLTNGVLLRGDRLARLQTIANDNLRIQVSLDGGRAEHHDPYRGAGTWAQAVKGIERLQAQGIQVCISTTETPANSAHLDELHTFRRSLGIADEDHFVRPLAKRGFSQQGIEVSPDTLLPEVTVTREGVYWHPLISPTATDMRVSEQIFPLAQAVEQIRQRLASQDSDSEGDRTEFT